jgi:hypothetical protein
MRAYGLIKTAAAEYSQNDGQDSGLSNAAKAAIAAGLVTAGGAGLKYGGPKLADHMINKINALGNEEGGKIAKMLAKEKDGKKVYQDANAAKDALSKKWKSLKDVANHKHMNKALIGGGITTAGLAGYDLYDRNRG